MPSEPDTVSDGISLTGYFLLKVRPVQPNNRVNTKLK